MKLPPSITKNLEPSELEFLSPFFSHCPDNILQNISLKNYRKGHTLIHSDDSCAFVYILLRGRLQAIEEHNLLEPYSFTELCAIDIVGDYELFTGVPSRAVTLITLEKTICLVIPSNDYISWMKRDSNALFIRTKMLISQMMHQTQSERKNMFLDNHTRLINFLYNECSKNNTSAFPIKITYTRSELSNRIGCSLRTVNRAILKLSNESIISLRHGKIWITLEQFHQLKKLL